MTGAVALAAISAPFCGAVVGVAGEAAARITAAAGGGDIAQGLQEIMCGWNGDSESESYNLVRDTLYSGNETAYQISTGRQLLARDLFELKRVYPDIPNSAYRELIDMNIKMYPEMRK